METTSPIKRQFTISVPPEAFQRYVDSEFEVLQKKAKVDGFRKGKVPLSILRQRYLSDVKAEAFSKVVQEAYVKALEENEVLAVGRPEIETKENRELDENKPLTFVARFEVYPEIKIADLSKLTVTKPTEAVTEEDIRGAVDRLLESHAEMVSEDRGEDSVGAKNGDMVVLSFDGSLANGRKVNGLKADDRLFELGKGQFMESFENGVMGMKAGEEKNFPVVFPENFSDKELAGQTVEFSVKLHGFKTKVMPPFDDDFAKKVGAASTQELKQKIEKNLETHKKREASEHFHENILRELIKAHPFEVPEALKQNQVEHLLRENFNTLRRQGFTEKMIDQYFKENVKEFYDRAGDQVRGALLMQKIAQEQKIQVLDSDIEAEFERLAKEMNEREGSVRNTKAETSSTDSKESEKMAVITPDQVRNLYKSRDPELSNFKFRLKQERTFAYLTQHLKVKDEKQAKS